MSIIQKSQFKTLQILSNQSHEMIADELGSVLLIAPKRLAKVINDINTLLLPSYKEDALMTWMIPKVSFNAVSRGLIVYKRL